MFTEQQASAIAQTFLVEQIQARVDEPLVLVSFETYPTCFVATYTTRRFVETGEMRFALAGNGPIIVNRLTGAVRKGSSGLPVEDQLDQS